MTGFGRFVNQLPHYLNLLGGSASELFNSMYESFQALTSIQVSHFVEWFSGSALTDIWTEVNANGTGTFQMEDEIDGGFSVTTQATGGGQSLINFGNRRHYNPQDSILIAVVKRASAGCLMDIGLTNPSVGSGVNSILCRDYDGNTYVVVITNDGVTTSETASDVAVNTDWNDIKLDCNSVDVKLYYNGVLKVTKTTHRPTVKTQPYFLVYTDSSGADKIQIRYLEVYNNSITILSSLYERLSALTQIAGQRMVETFVGAAIQSNRWTVTAKGAGGTGTIADSVDGGYQIATASTGVGDGLNVGFNGKRQYNFASSEIIFTCKMDSVSSCQLWCGFMEDWTGDNDTVVMAIDSTQTFFQLRTAVTGSDTNTDTDISLGTDWHSFKITLNGTSAILYIDGVLKATNTGNYPTNKLEPNFHVVTRGASAQTGRFRYIEAWNTLATPATFESVYEMFNPLTTIAKSHFWEWFEGNNLDYDRWVSGFSSGGGTFQMADGIDNGYEMVHVNQVYSEMNISFGSYAGTGKRVFDYNACNFIAVSKMGRTTDVMETLGLWSDNNDHKDCVLCWVATNDNAFINLESGDTTTASHTASDVANHTNWMIKQIIIDGTDMLLYLDGVLKVTKTTNYPTKKLEPIYQNMTRSSTGFTASIRYMEVKNV